VRATEDDAASAIRRFVEFFETDGADHFAIEEELILPAALEDERGRELAERILEDHRAIRAAAEELASGAQPGLERVHEVGARLRDHVRLEERELFTHLEETLPAERLEELGRLVAAAEAN
jgi:hemerythrin superfamily protein